MTAVDLFAVLSLSGMLLSITIGTAFGIYLFCKSEGEEDNHHF